MPRVGTSTAATAVSFLTHLRERYAGPRIVFWDNAPAHGGDPSRAYLATPELHLRLVRLPAYRPDLGADEAIGDGVRDEVTANTCVGTAANVRAHVDPFFAGLASRTDEVTQRCFTVLQASADALHVLPSATAVLHDAQAAAPTHGDSTSIML